MLLIIGLVLIFHDATSAVCVSVKSQHKVPAAPTLEINTLEFPDEHVLPIGYNVTVICTSNASKANYGNHYYGQPYWTQYYFNDEEASLKDCGGHDGDSEDSKVCTFSIQNATQKDSGNYTCWAHNRMTCTEGTLNLDFRETVRECNETFFYLHPESVTASSGDHVVFTCAVKGCSVPKITWLKNGLANVDGEGKSYQGQENATSLLTIDAVEIKNGGNYSCQATSSMGNVTSREAVLIIKGDTSHSTGVSKVVWISITITAVLLVVLVVLVFVIHKECRKANLKDQKEASEQQRFPHLHIHEGAMNQPLRNSNAYVAPHLQMTRMAVGNGTRMTVGNEE